MTERKRRTPPNPPDQQLDPVGSIFAPATVVEPIPVRDRRNAGHPHPATGDFYRVEGDVLDTRPRLTAPTEERGTETHRTALASKFKLLPPELQRSEVEIYDEFMAAPGARPAWAAAEAHREMVAAVLAVGGTNREAADYAGITEGTVHRFLTDADFRLRVQELREHTVARITGRIVRRLEALTDDDTIGDLPVKDLLAILDRTSGAKSATAPGVTVNVQQNNYDSLLTALSRLDSRSEGVAFPTYGPDVIPVPGGGSRVVRPVSGVEHGPEGREE